MGLIARKNKFSSGQINKAALNAFFNLISEWQISSSEAQILLGEIKPSTYYQWKSSRNGILPKDTLDRISYLLGIYKALRILYSDPDNANAWVKKPNKTFNGSSALDVMLGGQIVDIAKVRSYLDAQRGY